MKEVMIIGTGEIGTSLKNIEESAGNMVYTRDIDPSSWQGNLNSHYDVVHIAIPFTSQIQFVQAIRKHLWSITAEIIIIHSTIAVGTTAELIRVSGTDHICHSFVRGVHPHLEEGMLTFEKPIGTHSDELAMKVILHYKSIGIPWKRMCNAEASEMAKLLSTTAYAWNIFYADMVNKLCKEYNLPYDEVQVWATESYNRGYEILDKPNVKRPVLFPPDGPIGGHCILPNIKLLPSGTLKDHCEELSKTTG